MHQLSVGFVVKDCERLPDGRTDEDVVDEVRAMLQAVLDEWHEEGGKELLTTSPDVF